MPCLISPTTSTLRNSLSAGTEANQLATLASGACLWISDTTLVSSRKLTFSLGRHAARARPSGYSAILTTTATSSPCLVTNCRPSASTDRMSSLNAASLLAAASDRASSPPALYLDRLDRSDQHVDPQPKTGKTDCVSGCERRHM